MIQINLLPAELRQKSGRFRLQKSAMATLALSASLVALIVGLTYFQHVRLAAVQRDIARVEAKTRQMKDDIKMVDRLVDLKARILRRLGTIETLDRDRAAWVQNLEDLATVIPDFLWLSEFKQGDINTGITRRRRVNAPPVNADSVKAAQNRLSLKGYAYTVGSLANLILNLQDSPRFSHVQLFYSRLTKVNTRPVYDFQVVCRLEPIDKNATNPDDAPPSTEELGRQAPDERPLLGAADTEGE